MISDDTNEMQRIAERNKKIEKLLAEGDTKTAATTTVTEPSTSPESRQEARPQPRTYHGRTLRPYERINAKGRVEVFRPPTTRELDEDNDAALMASVKRQADEHKAKVDAANRDNEREQKRLDEQRERELRTGRRPMRDPNRISLAEAARRGLIGQSSNDNGGKPEWYSPGNPDGLMGGGRR